MTSSSQFRTAGPPALDIAQWAADVNEVKALGSATGSTRTADQTYTRVGGRARRSRAGTPSPVTSSHGTGWTSPTARDSSRCRTWARRTRGSTAGTT